jgi:bifunctional non-homologous end joining protein LigD
MRMPMTSPLDILAPDERELVREAPAPAHARLMKAVLHRESFSDPDWLFERKLDGIRCLAIRTPDGLRMLSRNDLDLGGRYPGVRDALAAQDGHAFAIDGELVAFAGTQTSFQTLVARDRDPRAVFLYAFDVLWLDGYDVRALPLRTRKRLLRSAIAPGGPLRLSTHRNGAGEAMFDEACRRGWEGVIAKRADSPYRDARSRDWLKLKCEAGQELVIGGYTAPKGSRSDFGALLVGYYDGGALRYAGKVGTGFSGPTITTMSAQLAGLDAAESPFVDVVSERRVHWVRPALVANVAFSEWTRDGRLRHPRFEGLRSDKDPATVTRERPARP